MQTSIGTRILITVALALLAALVLRPITMGAQEPVPVEPTAIVKETPTATLEPTATAYPTQTPYPTAPPPGALPALPTIPAAEPILPPVKELPGVPYELIALADVQLHEIQLQLELLQSARLAGGGELLQLPSTHEKPPAHSSAGELELTPPDLTRRVGIDSWYSNQIKVPADMAASVRVDTYRGPAGAGYVLAAEMLVDGVRWQRAINIGPEAGRELPWTVVILESTP